MATTIAPYGSWRSPITSEVVIEESISLMEVKIDPFQEDKVFWSEMRPNEDGRYVVCSWTEGRVQCHTPADFSSRTLVHEYGGGAFLVYNYRIYFSNYKDQRLYCQKLKKLDSEPIPLTPEGVNWRYADGTMYQKHIIVCVREDHDVISQLGASEAQNTLVSINRKNKKQVVLVSGANFYSTPRVSQHGILAWVQWDHPNMPWDSTELWVGELSHDGQSLKDGTKRKVVGGDGISVMLPKWSPDDKLMYIHDKTNWWNLYKLEDDVETNLHPKQKEIGEPAWRFAGSPYSCNPTDNGDILVVCDSRLLCLKPSGEPQEIQLDTEGYKSFSKLHYSPDGNYAYMVAGGPTMFTKLIRVDIASGTTTEIKASHGTTTDYTPYFSTPTEVSWDTTHDATAYGYYYPPQNKDYEGPKHEYPPLLVKVHGGPTSACSPTLDLNKQFFTSRGFAVLDVNYRGSTGFGTKYRNALKKNWGILDIEDCCSGAQAMADQKKADPAKLVIDGGSAGGFAALAALTFHNVFSAGASFYGIGDLVSLAKDTHKFESRYTDTLIGPLKDPGDDKVYIARSPINRVDLLKCALCIFQGSEDKVVPPNQSKMMYEAAKENGYPVAYKLFEGEQHGFRKAENIKFCLDGEFYFYSEVFKFDAPGIEVDLPIENLPE